MTTRVITGARIALTQGEQYRSRIRVDAPSVVTPKEAIAARLEDEGFARVAVYKDPSELPADWPTDQRAQVGSGFSSFTAFAEGTWARPSETVPRPEPVIAIWVARSPPSEGPHVTEGSHAWARDLLSKAWESHHGAKPTPAAAQGVQAISLYESGYGRTLKTPDGQPSNNWGSIQCGRPPCGANCFEHGDTNAKGVGYKACFRLYPDPYTGARDFVRVLTVLPSRQAVRDELAVGNATAIARAMHTSGYFEQAPAIYAKGISNTAHTIATALGEPTYIAPSSFLAAIASIGVVAGLAFFGYRRERAAT